jgi:hypothetical protein
VKATENQLPKGLVDRAQCPPGTSFATSNEAYRATQVWQAGLSLTLIGAILVASGLSWHFLEPGPTHVAVSLDRGLGVAVHSTF